MVDPPYRMKNMMPGMIMIWPYSIATIPSGWHLCDGTAGTVDLRNCYLACAGDLYTPMQSFGSDAQQHAFTGDGHSHDLPAGDTILDSWPAGDFSHNATVNPATGTTDAADNRPQSKAVNFIQKL